MNIENNNKLDLILNDFISNTVKNDKLKFIQFNNENNKLDLIINKMELSKDIYIVLDNYFEKRKIIELFKKKEYLLNNRIILMKNFVDLFYDIPKNCKFIINNFSNFKYSLENSINFIINEKYLNLVIKEIFKIENYLKNEDIKDLDLNKFNDSRLVKLYISIHNNYNFKNIPGNFINNLHFLRFLKLIAFYFKGLWITKNLKNFQNEEFLKLIEEGIFIKRFILKYTFYRYQILSKELKNNNLVLESFAKIISIIGLISNLDISIFYEEKNKQINHYISIKYFDIKLLFNNLMDCIDKVLIFNVYFREMEINSNLFNIKDIVNLNNNNIFHNLNIKIITNSIDQTKYQSNYEDLDKLFIFRNFGNFLNQYIQNKSGGTIVYFNNISFLEKMIFELNRLGILETIMLNKTILIDNLNKENLENIINIYYESIIRGKSVLIFSIFGRKLENLLDNENLNNFIIYGNFFNNNNLNNYLNKILYYERHYEINKILYSQSIIFEEFFNLTDFLIKKCSKKNIILVDYNHPKKFKYYYSLIKDQNYLNIQFKNYNTHDIVKF